MSGDLQPRKRREKKKKKDDVEETSHPHFVRTPTPPSDDLNIHVHKDSSTGGGLCAKFVFFILLGILAVLIGLIISEHRGLTDLEATESESRFSQIFEGWVDKSSDHDDHGEHLQESQEHDEEDEHKSEVSEEDEHEEEEASEEEDDVSHQDDEDEDNVSDEDDEEKISVEENVSDEDNDTNEDNASDEDKVSEEDKISDEDDADEDNDDEDDEDKISEEVEEEDKNSEEEDIVNEEEENDEDDKISEEDKQQESEEAEEVSEEVLANTESKEEANEDDDKSPEDESKENIEEQDVDKDEDVEDDKEPVEATNEGVVVKFGVGVAILVVAYVVLVRKWKSDKIDEVYEKSTGIDLSRRNTIVVPPKVEEVENVILKDEEEEVVEQEIKLHPKVKEDYQQLRTTYERSLTPESEPENSYDEEEAEEIEDIEEEALEEEEEEDEDLIEEEDEIIDDEEDIEDEEEIEEEEEDIESISDDLIKKFEAKYGKLNKDLENEEMEEEEVDSEDYEDEEDEYDWKHEQADSKDQKTKPSQSGAQDIYEFDNITSSYDYAIKDELDETDQQNNFALALVRFNKILDAHPKSPRALFGKANCLDQLADKERSNELLRKSIDVYLKIFNMEDVPDVLYQQAAERCINRMRFIGFYGRAISVHNLLIRRFPDEIKFRNQLAITYLTVNKIKEARTLLVDTLRRWPNDGVALVHYGFILKVSDNNLKEGMKYLAKGLKTKAEGVVDGRFYFHLGDALTRLGKLKQAKDVFMDGVTNKVFLSLYQRSLYNVNRLTGKPWWNIEDIPRYQQFFKSLEANYKAIRDEGTKALNGKGSFQDEAENLRDKGDWKQLELYARGVKNKENCKRCPFTCKLVETLSDATGCRRGQIKFSVMHPGTHVWPHCGPTNCRLRSHLGLVIPPSTYIRVAQETRSWREGKVLIFDDSFEHEVWHNGTDFRLVLIVDTWHPELTVKEKRTLSSI